MDQQLNPLRAAYEPRLQAVAAGAPAVYQALVGAWAACAAAVDPVLLARVQDRVEQVLDPRAGTPAPADSPELALVDQFVDFVADVDDDLRAPLLAAYGTRLRPFVEAVYIVDQSVRLALTHERLFAGEDWGVAPEQPEPTRPLPPTRANMRWHDGILAHGGIDDLTRETVRIRAGWHHDCGLCNSMRLTADDRVLVSPELVEQIIDYQQRPLGAAHTAALRYADAHMVEPAGLSPELAAELEKHFDRAQLLQLTLELSSWNYQKVLVALAIDDPVSTEGLTAITVGTDGSIQIGRLLEPVH